MANAPPEGTGLQTPTGFPESPNSRFSFILSCNVYFEGSPPLPGPFAGFWRAPSGAQNAAAKVGPPAGLAALKLPPRTPPGPACAVRRPGPATSAGPMAGGARVDRRDGPRGPRELVRDHQGPPVRRRAGRTPCSSPPTMGIRRSTGSRSCSPGPRGGAAHRTSRTTPTSPPEPVRRPVRVEDVARVRPPRTERATRGDRFQHPGTPRGWPSRIQGTPVLDPGTGVQGSPGRGTLPGLALLPPPTVSRSPAAPGPTSRGAPRYPRDMPRAPLEHRGSPTCSSPTYRYTASRYAPVLPVSARGARRTSRRRTRTPPVPVSPWPYRWRPRYGTGVVRGGARRRTPGDVAAQAPGARRGSQGRVPWSPAPREGARATTNPVPSRTEDACPPSPERRAPPAVLPASTPGAYVRRGRRYSGAAPPGTRRPRDRPGAPHRVTVSPGSTTSCSGTRSPGSAGEKYIPYRPSNGPYGGIPGSTSPASPRGSTRNTSPGELDARTGGPSGQCYALGALLRGSAGRRRAARSR